MPIQARMSLKGVVRPNPCYNAASFINAQKQKEKI